MILRKPLQSLDDIHADEQLKERTLSYVMSHQKRQKIGHKQQRMAFLVACLLFLIPITSYFTKSPTPIQPAAILSLDINPSIEFSLDEKYHILSVKAFNKDAESIIQGISMEGKPVEEAILTLFSQPEYATYLETGFLEVGVYSEKATVSDELNEKMNELLSKQLETTNYHCSKVDEATHNGALEHHVSSGKYRVIEAIRTFNASLSIEDLSKKSMQDLYDQLATYDPNAVPEGCGSSGQNGNGHHYGWEK